MVVPRPTNEGEPDRTVGSERQELARLRVALHWKAAAAIVSDARAVGLKHLIFSSYQAQKKTSVDVFRCKSGGAGGI
jgi:hypothetical protein